MSPDDYRKASGYRRSSASGTRLGRASAPQAFTAMEFDSPVLREFLGGGRMSAAGVAVTEKLAMRNSAFFRAVKLISTSIGMLPIHLHRRKPDGTTEKAKDHPLYRVLHKRPNGYQTALEFKAFMQLVALLDGNAYARVVWGVKSGKPAVLALVPFKRRAITPDLTEAGEITFKYQPPTGGQTTFAAKDVFHFRHPVSTDGLKGVSLLDVAVETLGLASAAERALAKMLAKGVMAGGAIELPQGTELSDDAYARLKASMNEDYSGVENAGDWFLLEDGAVAKPFASAGKSHDDLLKLKAAEQDGKTRKGVLDALDEAIGATDATRTGGRVQGTATHATVAADFDGSGPAAIAPATAFSPSGAPEQVVPDVDPGHPAVDNDPRAGTTVNQNKIDFNDPTLSGDEAVKRMLQGGHQAA